MAKPNNDPRKVKSDGGASFKKLKESCPNIEAIAVQFAAAEIASGSPAFEGIRQGFLLAQHFAHAQALARKHGPHTPLQVPVSEWEQAAAMTKEEFNNSY